MEAQKTQIVQVLFCYLRVEYTGPHLTQLKNLMVYHYLV